MYSRFIMTMVLFCLSVALSSDNGENHFRMYITADVKGETEPCG